MANGKGRVIENATLTYWFTTAAMTVPRPTAWTCSLHTAAPGASGANEVTTTGTATGNDTNYARKAVTFTAPAAAVSKNSTQVTFPTAALPTGGGASSYSVSHFGVWGTSTGGTQFVGAGTMATKTLADGEQVDFATGAISLTED